MSSKPIQLVKQIGHFADHIVIDVTVACKCLRSFTVSGKFSDEVRVFDFLVEVADEGASGHV